jgi:UPF0716 protein FxsA
MLLLFVLLPALELGLLISVGRRIGTLETVGVIVATGVVGASLARSQGLQVLARLQDELGAGRLPAEPLVDGLIILVAAALLVTPGVLTDAFGLLCLVPAFRRVVKRWLRRRFEREVAEGRVRMDVHHSGMGTRGPIIDITPERDEEGERPRSARPPRGR